VSGITPTATTVTQGSTFSYSYAIGNTGAGAASSTYSGIYLDSQSNKLPGWDGYDSIGSLAPGGSYTDSNSFSTAGLTVGTHTLWIKADDRSEIAESDESNNWTSLTFTVGEPPRPDGRVLDILMDGSTVLHSVHPGDSVRLDFLVQNVGTADIPPKTVLRWSYEGPASSYEGPASAAIDEGYLGEINGLQPGETETETDAAWTVPADLPEGIYTLKAVFDHVGNEIDWITSGMK